MMSWIGTPCFARARDDSSAWRMLAAGGTAPVRITEHTSRTISTTDASTSARGTRA
jgi:hypothetical protein